jgi:hypothetical protein
MLILNYAEDGNLHNYLQNNFINITWVNKLSILATITFGYLLYFFNAIIHFIYKIINLKMFYFSLKPQGYSWT